MESIELLPQKNLFKFSEVSSLTGVKPYVLRFWETEFEEIAPIYSHSGEKLYERKDVEVILKIKKYLFEDKISIPKAKLLFQKAQQAQESRVIVEQSQQKNIMVQTEGHQLSDEDRESLKKTKSILRNSLTFIGMIKTKRRWK